MTAACVDINLTAVNTLIGHQLGILCRYIATTHLPTQPQIGRLLSVDGPEALTPLYLLMKERKDNVEAFDAIVSYLLLRGLELKRQV